VATKQSPDTAGALKNEIASQQTLAMTLDDIPSNTSQQTTSLIRLVFQDFPRPCFVAQRRSACDPICLTVRRCDSY